MKAVYSLLAIFVMLTGSVYGAVNSEDILGIWLLEDDAGGIAEDSSENGRDGNIMGELDVVKGKFGNGFEFNGIINNYISVPHDEALNLGEFTITYWCKMDVSGLWQIPVLKVNVAASGANRNVDFQTAPEGGAVSVYFSQGANQWKGAIGATEISDDKWHHIAGTYDLDRLLLYVDGVQDGEGDHGGDPDFMEDPLMFGSGPIWPYLGIIDDIGVFNKALSVDDIGKIMNNGLDKALGVTAVSSAGKLTATWGGIKEPR